MTVSLWQHVLAGLAYTKKHSVGNTVLSAAVCGHEGSYINADYDSDEGDGL